MERALEGVRLHGSTDPVIVEEMFARRLGRAPRAEETAALLKRYLVHLEEEIAATAAYRVLPGVGAALDLLEARGATIGLATGNIERGAEIKLRRGDLWRRFGFGGYGSDAAERAHLVARAIQRGAELRAATDDGAAPPRGTAERAGRRFERVLVIGDTEKDVAAAHACGATAVGVATGPCSTADLAAAGADRVLETLDELPGRL